MNKGMLEFNYLLNKLSHKVGIGTRLILIVSLHILIIGGNAYIAYVGIDKIAKDSAIVNQSGVIRGGIQKISKLITNNIEAPKDIEKVDTIFRNFLIINKEELLRNNMNAFVTQLEDLKIEWEILKKLFHTYQQNQNEINKTAIVKHSEKCWDMANQTVGMAQALSEAKLSIFTIMFMIFFLDFLLIIAIIWLINSAIRKNLEVVSRIDSLTGIFNRNVYNEEIYSEIQRCRRYGYSFSLLVLDIDHFKQVNDKYGHDIGDKILKQTATILNNNIRKSDCFCRIGGEEFVIIATQTDIQNAQVFGEKLLSAIAEYNFDIDRQITISIGLTTLHLDDTKDTIFKRADEALYTSKTTGRNKLTTIA